jgi:hypothetical protein
MGCRRTYVWQQLVSSQKLLTYRLAQLGSLGQDPTVVPRTIGLFFEARTGASRAAE